MTPLEHLHRLHIAANTAAQRLARGEWIDTGNYVLSPAFLPDIEDEIRMIKRAIKEVGVVRLAPLEPHMEDRPFSATKRGGNSASPS